ncbi:hypothetical protein AMTRI_Chr13g91240 [Amborella trichopoda]|uniref:Methyltransferase FkbM domain-containing protein n=1 Tax=Amborella trichopoda TaxID=13333 RepID=W1PS86_AMBTC|nr:uncharacterized protein LOC18438278 [Amborella trichopoda]XP_011624977.1 uncharacterized protein LOC18438278 [Amborella trichopoda]XP_011624978.1 uncharacterized protein LOC18438278 [Amborella trichopoda]XP_020525612.1 uncharacterized protein LOC18438278 [Amborella trichopoda]ERN10115.1 hypothetical protein AMTR_s00169p00022730 [Amborella trichopoda]|eukprot:XP_006848534.1 uncharacterized protein LOC18438278 [Amborella trichopoda]
MAHSWRREKPFTRKLLLLLLPLSLLLLLIFLLLSSNPNTNTHTIQSQNSQTLTLTPIPPFDCQKCPPSSLVFANTVEGLNYPFLYSLADLGIPEKPHRNILRMLKGKPFRKPDISEKIQEILDGVGGQMGIVVDVGANVGMATFAATAMGFRVLAFEPVTENLQRLCDGVLLNRVGSQVTIFAAAASDRLGNITFHKLVGRLDNSAVSASGAKLAFKSNEEIAVEVASIPLDSVISDTQPVLLLKIDVQGWEYHVLRGASKLLSRKAGNAPYLIYEEDERLLQASNSSKSEIREFLASVGYHHCEEHGTDAHCKKD